MAFYLQIWKVLTISSQDINTSSSMEKNTAALLYSGSKYRKSMELYGVFRKYTGRFHFESLTKPA